MSDSKPTIYDKVAMKLFITRKKAKELLFAQSYGAGNKKLYNILKKKET